MHDNKSSILSVALLYHQFPRMHYHYKKRKLLQNNKDTRIASNKIMYTPTSSCKNRTPHHTTYIFFLFVVGHNRNFFSFFDKFVDKFKTGATQEYGCIQQVQHKNRKEEHTKIRKNL